MFDINKFLLDLINSLKESRYSFATSLIKSNHPLDIQDDEGKTALMFAIIKNKDDIIDLILESDNCDNKSLAILDRYGDNALSLTIKLDRGESILHKILKRMKYNLYKEIDDEIQKCRVEITELELEQLSIDFNLEAALSNLNFKVNPIDILKAKKMKLEEDAIALNNGISWTGDNMNILGINVAIKVAEKKGNFKLIEILKLPPAERVILKKTSNIKRVFKKPSSLSRRRNLTPDERRLREETEKMKKTIDKRSREQKLRREKLMSEKRKGYISDVDDDSDIDLGEILKNLKSRQIKKNSKKSKKKSKRRNRSKSKNKIKKSKKSKNSKRMNKSKIKNKKSKKKKNKIKKSK